MKVPFSPYFLSQVQSGRVASIASKGDTIQGTFKSAERYPASDAKATPTTLFATQVPSFWNNDQLTALLRSEGVQVNAQSTTQTTPLIESLLLGFGPTLLIVGLFVVFARRPPRAGAWVRWATSGAPRHGESTRQRSGSRSLTWPGSTRPSQS